VIAALGVLAASLGASGVRAAPVRAFKAPAGPLTSVLLDFAVQADISIGADEAARCPRPSLGVQGRLLLEFSSGYGFIGIAVALMGRAHPVGIVLASILFGMLYQGGTELSFEMPRVTRDMIVAISGLVSLFAGALDGLIRRPVAGVFARFLKSGT
jgi:hypothetical protein